MFGNLNESNVKTTLSCPYCIGWFPGMKKKNKKYVHSIRLHAMMSNLQPVCGPEKTEPKYTEDALTLPQAIRWLERKDGCGKCRRMLETRLKKESRHANL